MEIMATYFNIISVPAWETEENQKIIRNVTYACRHLFERERSG
jgi:hypothetical protein